MNLSEKVERFTESLETLLMKMQEADNTCMELTKDLSKREFAVLTFVGKHNEVIMRQIADYLSIPVSTTTGVVDKMVEKGYLKRYHSEEDRRTIKIALSKYGMDSFGVLMSTLHTMVQTMLMGLEDKDQTKLVELFEKISGNLKNYVPRPENVIQN